MSKWRFEVYNEADLHWEFSDYATMYTAAAKAIKSVSTKLLVGGPASARPEWVGKLISLCSDPATQCPLDFVSTHTYPPIRASVRKRGLFSFYLSIYLSIYLRRYVYYY